MGRRRAHYETWANVSDGKTELSETGRSDFQMGKSIRYFRKSEM